MTPARLPLLVLALVALAPFAGVLGHDFLNWDDLEYVPENALLDRPDGLIRIWTGFDTPQVYPMVFTSFWLEHRVWGDDPAGYHAVNLLLHALATLLLYRLLLRLRASPAVAFAVALLFAVHPTQVATVAWVAERKNVLSAVFAFAALASYIGAARAGSRRGLAISVGLGLLAMLSKTSAVVLPAAVLLLEWWGFAGDRRTAWKRVLPFAAPALLLSGLTVFREHGPEVVADVGLADRIAIAGRAAWFYAGKLLVPSGLSGVYPRWIPEAGRLAGAAGWAGIVLVAGSVALARGLPRTVAFGLAWFALAGLPTSGVIPFGYMEKSFVADHFLYLPAWGFWLAVFALIEHAAARASERRWGVGARAPEGGSGARASEGRGSAGTGAPEGRWGASARALEGRRSAGAGQGGERALRRLSRAAPVGIALALAAAFVPVTVRQVGFWRDSGSFWAHVLERDPQSWLARGNLGHWHAVAGRYDSALDDLSEAVRLRPDYAEAHFNLGYVYQQTDRLLDARDAYETAVRLAPIDAGARNNLGVVLLRIGNLTAARREFEAALRLTPEDPALLQNLGFLTRLEQRQSPVEN